MSPVSCPICRRSCEATGATHPFCSERCRTIDLGRWLGGEYRIAGEESPLEGNDGIGGDVSPGFDGEPN